MAGIKISNLSPIPSPQLGDLLASVQNTGTGLVTYKVTESQLVAFLNGQLSYLPLSGGILTGDLFLNADPTQALQAATKQYVDTIASGISVQSACRLGTTGNLTAVYANGASGVGATLTNSGTQASLSIDGIAAAVNDRILVKDQTAQLQNGIYIVSDIGSGSTNWILMRATDYNTPAQIQPGDLVIVTAGTTNTQTSWIETATVSAIGSSPIVFNQFNINATYDSIFPTIVVTATSGFLTVNTKFIANNAALVTLTLPTISAVGQEIAVQGLGSGGWKIVQNALQVIHVGSVNTTVGAGGSLASTNRYDSVRLICVVANLEWALLNGPQGNLTIV